MWTHHLKGGPSRVNHAAVAIYSFGGFFHDKAERCKDRSIEIYALDTETLRWRQVRASNPVRPLVDANDQYRHIHGNDHDLTEEFLPQYHVPFQRYGHTAVVYEKKVYLWGGRGSDDVSSHLHEFDPETSSWKYVQVGTFRPGGRDGHTATVYKDQMWVVGGFDSEINLLTTVILCFDFTDKGWYRVETTGEIPYPRDFHSAVELNGQLYLWGGRGDSSGYTNGQNDIYFYKVHALDLKTRVWKSLLEDPNRQPYPFPRRSQSSWVYNGLIYFFGGFNGKVDRTFNDLWVFDPDRLMWQKINTQTQAPSKRRRQCTVVVKDKAYLFGGTSPTLKERRKTLINNADLHVFDYAPSLFTRAALCLLQSSNFNRQVLANPIRNELDVMTRDNPEEVQKERGDRGFYLRDKTIQ